MLQRCVLRLCRVPAATPLGSGCHKQQDPLRPQLVAPKLVKRRAMHTVEGRAAMVHALAHIEFNAINLALDALWRAAAQVTAPA